MTGEELRRLRAAVDISQRELAEAAHCSKSAISLYESGHRQISANVETALRAAAQRIQHAKSEKRERLEAFQRQVQRERLLGRAFLLALSVARAQTGGP